MKTTTAMLTFSWLLAAATLFGQTVPNPCPKTNSWTGVWDFLALSPGNSTVSFCVSITPDDQGVATQFVPVVGALTDLSDFVTQNVPAGQFGFYQVTGKTATWLKLAPDGSIINVESGSGSLASAGGYAYAPISGGGGLNFRFPSQGKRRVAAFPAAKQLLQTELSADGSTDWWRTQCGQIVQPNGFEICNKNGSLTRVNNDSFGNPNYELGGQTVGPNEIVVDVVAGSGGTVYVTTAATTPDKRNGGLFALSVDGNGTVSDMLICRCAYVPGDGRVRLAVGQNGVYVVTAPGTIELFTPRGPVGGFAQWTVLNLPSQDFGALAVLTADVPNLP